MVYPREPLVCLVAAKPRPDARFSRWLRESRKPATWQVYFLLLLASRYIDRAGRYPQKIAEIIPMIENGGSTRAMVGRLRELEAGRCRPRHHRARHALTGPGCDEIDATLHGDFRTILEWTRLPRLEPQDQTL